MWIYICTFIHRYHMCIYVCVHVYTHAHTHSHAHTRKHTTLDNPLAWWIVRLTRCVDLNTSFRVCARMPRPLVLSHHLRLFFSNAPCDLSSPTIPRILTLHAITHHHHYMYHATSFVQMPHHQTFYMYRSRVYAYCMHISINIPTTRYCNSVRISKAEHKLLSSSLHNIRHLHNRYIHKQIDRSTINRYEYVRILWIYVALRFTTTVISQLKKKIWQGMHNMMETRVGDLCRYICVYLFVMMYFACKCDWRCVLVNSGCSIRQTSGRDLEILGWTCRNGNRVRWPPTTKINEAWCLLQHGAVQEECLVLRPISPGLVWDLQVGGVGRLFSRCNGLWHRRQCFWRQAVWMC